MSLHFDAVDGGLDGFVGRLDAFHVVDMAAARDGFDAEELLVRPDGLDVEQAA